MSDFRGIRRLLKLMTDREKIEEILMIAGKPWLNLIFFRNPGSYGFYGYRSNAL